MFQLNYAKLQVVYIYLNWWEVYKEKMWVYLGIRYGYNRYKLEKYYSKGKWNIINLPGSVIIPFRDKFEVRQMIRSRPLLLHLMLKQGKNLVSFCRRLGILWNGTLVWRKTSFHPLLWTSSGLKGTWKLKHLYWFSKPKMC